MSMSDISGFGGIIQIRASVTFPAGITIRQYADDTDPFDIPTQEIGDLVLGVNGDAASFTKATPIVINLSVFPQTDDGNNLDILFNANRVQQGKNSANDDITIIAIYPNGKFKTYGSGRIVSGMPGFSIASSARLKTMIYGFKFGTYQP